MIHPSLSPIVPSAVAEASVPELLWLSASSLSDCRVGRHCSKFLSVPPVRLVQNDKNSSRCWPRSYKSMIVAGCGSAVAVVACAGTSFSVAAGCSFLVLALVGMRAIHDFIHDSFESTGRKSQGSFVANFPFCIFSVPFLTKFTPTFAAALTASSITFLMFHWVGRLC